MTESKAIARARSVTINGVWFDHFANLWYEYPPKTRTEFTQMPSICMRGHWISAAGFSVGEKLDIEVSANSITLKSRKKT